MNHRSMIRCLLAPLAAAWLAAPACLPDRQAVGAEDACTVAFPSPRGKTAAFDLSSIPRGAAVFRAELVLNPPDHSRPKEPTKVYVEGRPDKPLRFVEPRNVGLDATEAVRSAVRAGAPLTLRLDVTCNGARRLEVSYVGGKLEGRPTPARASGPGQADSSPPPLPEAIPAVTGLKVTHRAGQSMIVFTEPELDVSLPAVAPWDGVVRGIEVQPGQKVRKGDLLARMDVVELTRQIDAAKADRGELLKLVEDVKAASRPTAETRAAAGAARDKAEQLDRQIGRLTEQLALAEVRSPMDGAVADGDWRKHVGATVKGGAVLLELRGRIGHAAYPELPAGADVARLKQALARGHTGWTYRIWRAAERITPKTIAKAQLVGECGFLTAWNSTYHQDDTARRPPMRYRITDGGDEVPWGTGIYAHNPPAASRAFYAVTVAIDGREDFSTLGEGSATAEGVQETVGLGAPILQWTDHPKEFQYRKGRLTRHTYVRWESGEHSSTPSNPIDYHVVMSDDPMPTTRPREPQYSAYKVEPAPVGLHLHCWGGSLNGGYGWWFNGHRGAILIASNQIPYDWWTGYHEARGTCRTWGDGCVRPYTMSRLFGFLDWASTQWKLDLKRIFTAGGSMGGSGAPMYAIRYGDRIAWALGTVGVHIPAESPQFASSYRLCYGPEALANAMPDGTTDAWDFFSDEWFLRRFPKKETGWIIASNGKNDGAIGWPQAVKFARALQETRRPHVFNWGLGGHGTGTLLGSHDLDVRTDQTLPAFTRCTLDDDIGTGTPRTKEQIEAEKAQQTELKRQGKIREVAVNPYDGDPVGQYNGHLWWQTEDIVDTPAAWEMTVILKDGAPGDQCRVDLTPRRCQKFRTPAGRTFHYAVTDPGSGRQLAAGDAAADEHDLLTLRQIPLVKGRNRVRIAPAR